MRSSKFFLLGFVFSVFPFLLFSQINISFRTAVKVDRKINFDFVTPLEGRYFAAKKETFQVDKANSVSLSIPDTESGLFCLQVQGKRYFLYLDTVVSLQVTFDLNEKGFILVDFKGTNAAGYRLYNGFKRPFYHTLTKNLAKEYSDIARLNTELRALKSADLYSIDSLFQLGSIDRGFAEWAKASIETYYTAAAAFSMFNTYQDLEQRNSVQEIARPEVESYYELMSGILNGYDFSKELNSRSEYFISLMEEKRGLFDHAVDPEKMVIRNIDTTVWKDFAAFELGMAERYAKPEEFRELQLASTLNSTIDQDGFEAAIVDSYKKFEQAYPNSVFLPILKPKVEEVIAYIGKVSKDFSEGVRFVENSDDFQSFDDVLNWSKGKVVYVDIWATWCGPCKDEFAFNEGLKSFAKDHGVDILYISIDRASERTQWLELIKYYDLDGNHLITNAALSKDIRSKFSEDFEGQALFSIPLYMILKDGKIMNADAKRPGNKESLYEQIRTFL